MASALQSLKRPIALVLWVFIGASLLLPPSHMFAIGEGESCDPSDNQCDAGLVCDPGGNICSTPGDSDDGTKPFKFPTNPINLLEPLDDAQTSSIQAQPGLGVFYTYFNLSWPIIVGSAAGIGILQALIGGVQIMLSGNNSGMRDEGKNRLMWALAGLLMIGLSGLILEMLNPIAFRQV